MTIARVLVLCSIVLNFASAQGTELFRLRSEFARSAALPQDPAPVLQPERKSPAVGVIYSLLLPGMGEMYANGFDEGRYSLIAEGTLWLGYLSYRQYGTWLQSDARRFAASHAGAGIDGKNDRFFVDIGNFNDTYEYNDKKLIDRELEKVYDVSANYWRWDTDDNRREYRAMRVSSERVFNNSKFVVATIVVNHIISAINAARLIRLHNTQASSSMGTWWLESSMLTDGVKPDGVSLSLVRRF